MIGFISYVLLYMLMHVFLLIRWFRWRIVGLEHLPPRRAGGMVIVMNHVHWVDIPVIGTLLPLSYRLSWLAKSELFRNPFAAWWFRQMNVIPIKRGSGDAAALDAAVQALRAGAVLLIFPEGHRSRDGVLLPGRGGAVRLAMRAGVPIVPVAIVGTEHGLRGTLSRTPVLMQIGEPYMVAPLPGDSIPPEQMEALTTDMMCRIAAMLPAERRGPYGTGCRNVSSLAMERSATQPAASSATTRHQT